MNHRQIGNNIHDKELNLEIMENIGNYKLNNEGNINKFYNIERCEMKLSLRKKKINDKIFKRRKIDIQNYNNQKFNFDKFILLNDSFINLISSIKLECKNEDNIILLLVKMTYIIEQKFKFLNQDITHNIYNFTSDDLINNNWIENLYNLAKMYLNSPKVILYLTRLLLNSCILIITDLESDEINNKLYDEKETLNKAGYFISADKYTDIYNKIFEIYVDNYQIIYNMVIFIGQIAKNQKSNQDTLYYGGTLRKIIDSIDIEKESLKLLEEKIWCLSKFDEDKIYENNSELALKVQTIYINIFMNQQKYELFRDINTEMDENNFLNNYLQLIANSCACTENLFIENILKSNILENLMDNFINKDPKLINLIVDILMNMTNSNSDLLKRLINIGVVKFLISIITDKCLPLYLRKVSFVPINNLFSDSQVWNIVLFEQKMIKTICNLLNNNDIESGIFGEICFGFLNLINYCDNNNLNDIIDNYFIIQLICKAMKHIIYNENREKERHLSCLYFCSLILSFISINDDNLIKKIIYLFQKSGGEELLDMILCSYSNMDLENKSIDTKKEITDILNYVETIKVKIKDL